MHCRHTKKMKMLSQNPRAGMQQGTWKRAGTGDSIAAVCMPPASSPQPSPLSLLSQGLLPLLTVLVVR